MTNKDNKNPRESSPRSEGIPVVQPRVAGIDIGGTQHWVCAPPLDGMKSRGTSEMGLRRGVNPQAVPPSSAHHSQASAQPSPPKC